MHNEDNKNEFIKLTNDLLFKETFANVKPHILEDFLETMLDYKKGTLHNKLTVTYEKTLPKNSLQDKSFRGDVIIEYDNTIINLECYTTWEITSEEKSIYYVMRILSAQKKNKKKEVKQVIQINVVEENKTGRSKLFENIYQIVNLNNVKDILLKNKFMVKVFSLDSIKDSTYNMGNRKVKWLKFIGAKTEEEREQYAKGDKILMELTEWLNTYVFDDETKEYYGEWDRRIREKQENEVIDTAKGLLHSGNHTFEEIADITGLMVYQVEHLQTIMKEVEQEVEQTKELLRSSVYTPEEISKITGLRVSKVKELQEIIQEEIRLEVMKEIISELKPEVKNSLRVDLNPEEVKEQGKLEGAIEIAKNFLNLGIVTIKQIADATGLSQKEVKELQKKLEK